MSVAEQRDERQPWSPRRYWVGAGLVRESKRFAVELAATCQLKRSKLPPVLASPAIAISMRYVHHNSNTRSSPKVCQHFFTEASIRNAMRTLRDQHDRVATTALS
jgi:hypothetical protein